MVRRRHGLSTHVWPGFETSWHVTPELNRGMWADDAAHPIDWLLWLLGEPARLKWYLHADGTWTHSDIASPKNHAERIAALAWPLLGFLRGRRPPIATAEEGRTALRMTLACYESSERGARVRLR